VVFNGHIQKNELESCEEITRLASFTDAETLTDRQLKLSDPGMHSILASSSSHRSVRVPEAPGPIRPVMELMKLFNSHSDSDIGFLSIATAFSIDFWLWITRNSDMALLDSGGRGSRAGASIQILNWQSEHAP